MENVTKITTENENNAVAKKDNIFKRAWNSYKTSWKEHPVKTGIGTGVTAAAVTLIVWGTVKLVKGSGAEAAVETIESAADDVYRLTDLPDTLGFDQMKLVNPEGEILADTIIDMGTDYVVASDYNVSKMASELGKLPDVENVLVTMKEVTEVAGDIADDIASAAL